MLLLDVKVKKNLKLDFFHLEESSDSNVNIFNDSKYKPKLNSYSRFLVTFDDGTTKSEGIANMALGYTFSIYKEVKDTNQLTYVAKLNEGVLSVTDYNVVNNKTYNYYIFKEDNDTISEAVISNSVETCWWNWSIVDLIPSTENENIYIADSRKIWLLDLNLSSSSKNQNISSTVYNNLSQFPKVSIGYSNYSSSSLSCLLGKVGKSENGTLTYIEDAGLLDEWNNFCANGNIKLLKDRKGNAMLVMITGTSSQTDDITVQQANTITFEWVQVASNDNITIVGN